ncbi:hypothetical protein C8Q80DRAFT_166822 [Daedaleopsis nitida]|nr:hypothetical protein C8Q80DRAFT_166822 [Daedaleopsis nitida]
MMAPMAPPSSPTPAGKRASTARRSSDTASSSDTQNTVASVFRPTTADEQAAVPHATGALGRGPLLHPTLVVSALHAASNAYDSQHRPSTPERPITPPRLPTSCSDLPSTPRLAQLESELFNFESPVPSNTRVTPKSPSLSVFNSRAPLLHMGSIEEFLAADPPPFPARTPLGLPRTPKKSPIAGGSSSVFSFSAISPFSTPSRRASRPATATSDLDEELARYLHTSPFNFNFSYDGVIAGVSSDTHAGSPGAPSW